MIVIAEDFSAFCLGLTDGDSIGRIDMWMSWMNCDLFIERD